MKEKNPESFYPTSNFENNQYQLDMTNNLEGIYFLKVAEDEKGVFYKKIILSKNQPPTISLQNLYTEKPIFVAMKKAS